ncbi:hypothetical protein CBP36_21180 (plasmid) [Acidovorax carolinensis]|uniref:Uncharacterized protein n=1 Tax=Acidovorax carolinensis TaxID=553814 RepID=A0A240UK81_9BURK|nr:hypothetical protein [Acidovorax carolinensis]ART61483.1 hypothetical protein CBP36_21180 [Acidovorax carolinensis]
MLIEIKVENIQGQIRFLPAGDLAQRLAAVNRVEALAPSMLNAAAERLDAEVVVVEGNCLEAAQLLAQHLHPVTQH